MQYTLEHVLMLKLIENHFMLYGNQSYESNMNHQRILQCRGNWFVELRPCWLHETYLIPMFNVCRHWEYWIYLSLQFVNHQINFKSTIFRRESSEFANEVEKTVLWCHLMIRFNAYIRLGLGIFFWLRTRIPRNEPEIEDSQRRNWKRSWLRYSGVYANASL